MLGLACSSVYSSKGAETLPANQIGVLEHDNPVQSDIVIQSVDGEWRGAGAKTTYRLTPGPHALEVIVRSNGAQSSVRWFDVKPGRVYSIQWSVDHAAGQWGFWIVDKTSGDRVDYLRQ